MDVLLFKYNKMREKERLNVRLKKIREEVNDSFFHSCNFAVHEGTQSVDSVENRQIVTRERERRAWPGQLRIT